MYFLRFITCTILYIVIFLFLYILIVSLTKDQDIIAGSDISGDGVADYFTELSGVVITQLLPDEVVTLMLKANKTVNVSFNGSTNAKMSIIKLS